MMIAWIGYCLFVSALLGLAAFSTERALGHYRRPVRGVWAAALAGSAILPTISEIRNNRGDAGRRCALHGIDHYQQFHEIISGRSAGGLDHVNITATNVVHDLEHDLTVTEPPHYSTAHRHIEFVSNTARQPQVCVTRENHQ